MLSTIRKECIGKEKDSVPSCTYIESDFLFKLTYRFTKKNVEKITTELSLFLNLSTSNRGNPFTAVEVVCSGLEILGGGVIRSLLPDRGSV